MSRRQHIALSFALAAVATPTGLYHTFRHYTNGSILATACWFPFVAITGARELLALGLAILQFPLLAAVYSIGIQRWPTRWVIAVLFGSYAFAAALAYGILWSQYANRA